MLTTGLDPCLEAWSISEWSAFEERVAKLSQFDADVVRLRRVYISSAVECEIDKLGRMLIPQTLREHAGLTREVRWAGMGNHIELWDKAAFDAERKAVISQSAERDQMRRKLAELGL